MSKLCSCENPLTIALDGKFHCRICEPYLFPKTKKRYLLEDDEDDDLEVTLVKDMSRLVSEADD